MGEPEVEIPRIDHNHPLYLRESDTPALLVKNKLGFIERTCVKGSYKSELANPWERCNVVVLSWIGKTVALKLQPSIIYASNVSKVWSEFKERFDKSNLTQTYRLWKMIGSLIQGTDSVTIYYSKIKDLWDEVDLLVAGHGCDCEETRPFIEQFKNLRLLHFLVSLNESYSHVRSQVLLKTPMLTVNQAYALLIQEESQRTLGTGESNSEVLTMLTGKNQTFNQGFNAKNPRLICDFCGYKGHLKENCCKTIGYPPDFKSKKKAWIQGVKPYANDVAAETWNTSST
ncbi:uncharacterized protein LOC142180910 [Nicotiana tabacum]|uniref:Uncharacterized protein LOC142180910 n=1 Tax=Nicotiana tabacum TaxID=4097 RepID=A0AC58UIQ8_TOBAC